jgi:hypothetical protein
MSTAVPTHSSDHPSRTRLLPVAAAAAVVQLLMMIPGYSDSGGFQAGTWLAVLAFALVVSVLLFAFLVPTAGPVVGVVVGVVAAVSVLVFWAGITLPLAAAAAMIGWQARDGEQRPVAWAAIVLAAVSAVALVAIIVGDATT